MTRLGHVAFRADASAAIGAGHIMRCLALAESLRSRGVASDFICRSTAGNLGDVIRRHGFKVTEIPDDTIGSRGLGVADISVDEISANWRSDALETRRALGKQSPSWLVVDHYELDARWEDVVRHDELSLLVLDDLANRPHSSRILVDQNLGRVASDYNGITPVGSACLIGPQYALVRKEFAVYRDEALKRRGLRELRTLLISMGGSDPENATGSVLEALRSSKLSRTIRVDAVLGANAVWRHEILEMAQTLPFECHVHVDAQNMAALMTAADLAIGGAGGTAWERCCLGVPAIVVILADNQRLGALALDRAGAAIAIERTDIATGVLSQLERLSDPELRRFMSDSAASLVDGRGCERVTTRMYETVS